MQIVFNFSTFVFFTTVILSFVAGSVLLVFSKNEMVNNRWLAVYYIAAAYGFLVAFLLYSKLIFNFPWYHIYRTGYIAGLLLMPLSFFYIRSLIQQKKFRPLDLIHFLPVTIFIIDFMPFYFRTGAYKLQQLTIDSRQLNTVWSQFSQGWLGIGKLYVPIRVILSTLYWIVQVRMIYRSARLRAGSELVTENKAVIIWAKIFCAIQVLYFLPYYLNGFFGSTDKFFFVQNTIVAISVSITILILVFRPDILYGLKGIVVRNIGPDTLKVQVSTGLQTTDNVTNDDNLKIRLTGSPSRTANDSTSEEIYLSGHKLTELSYSITEYMMKERPFLKKGCTCAALAAEMNIPSYILSGVINHIFKTNFNDFLNGYRVAHAKTLIQNGEVRLLTLEALSEQCGFNNRNSFTIAFKKHTGQTPSYFIKKNRASML